jgi:predicted nucleotidyltransferase
MYLAEFHLTLLKEFQKNEVEFVLIGGHAAIFYGSDRTTGDMDLLVRPSLKNGSKILWSFNALNLEIDDLLPEDFEKNLVLTFGFEPEGVDIINYLKVLDFDTIVQNSGLFEISDGLKVKVIDARDLLKEKQNLNREGRKALTDQLDILSLLKFLEISQKQIAKNN